MQKEGKAIENILAQSAWLTSQPVAVRVDHWAISYGCKGVECYRPSIILWVTPQGKMHFRCQEHMLDPLP